MRLQFEVVGGDAAEIVARADEVIAAFFKEKAPSVNRDISIYENGGFGGRSKGSPMWRADVDATYPDIVTWSDGTWVQSRP